MLFGALGIAACAPGELDLEGKACPCIDGWVCDAVTETCVRESTRVDAGDRIDAGGPRDGGAPDGGDVDGARMGVDSGPTVVDSGPHDGGPADAGPIDSGPPPIEPPWWDATWGYRAQLTVMNTASAEAPVGLPVRLMVDLSALPASPSHLRLQVVRWDSGSRTWTTADYASNTPPAGVSGGRPVWFGLTASIPAGITDSTYWLYWDSATTADLRSPNRLFELWDSFGSASIGSDFVRQDPVSVSMDELVIDTGGSVRTSARWGPGHALDVLMRVPTFAPYFWIGFQRETDFVDGEPWLLWINRDWDPGRIWSEVKIGAIGHVSALEGSHLALGSTSHIYTIERFDDVAVFSRDYMEIDTISFGASYATPFQVRLRSSGTGPAVRIDWVRVRRVMRPMPMVGLGTPVARP